MCNIINMEGSTPPPLCMYLSVQCPGEGIAENLVKSIDDFRSTTEKEKEKEKEKQ